MFVMDGDKLTYLIRHPELIYPSNQQRKVRTFLKVSGRLEPLFRNNGNLRPKLASLLKLIAESLFNLSSCDKALDQLDVAIEDLQNNHYDQDQLWKLFKLKGHVLISAGRKNDAMLAFNNAADIVNDLRKAPLGYRLDSTYLEDKIPLFYRGH